MGVLGLNTALSGLNAAQKQLSLISSNIANANTEGYTRKTLTQYNRIIGGQGAGVTSGLIMRDVQVSSLRDFWTQVSAVSALDTKASYLEKIQQFHGAPDQEISVAAYLSDLRDTFIQLSDSPEDTALQRATVLQAERFADKVNDLNRVLSDLRNSAQNEIEDTVKSINDKLVLIQNLNGEIRSAIRTDRTTADLEDQRDLTVKELSEEIGITFFIRGDGVMSVQTVTGQELVSDTYREVTFTNAVLQAESYYPQNVSGVFIGDPDTELNAIDITGSNLQGRLGGLIELRDEILPEQQAMVDELAHQTAKRFDAQGLRLFTDGFGNIPDDSVTPDPTAGPPATSVDYVGFARNFQVNPSVLSDISLIQQGTVDTDLPVGPGSDEVLRRIVDFAFGDVLYEEAIGNVDLRVSGIPSTLQSQLGIHSEARILSSINLQSFTDGLADVVANANGALDGPADQFDITFTDPDLVNAPVNAVPKTITVDLSAAIAAFPAQNAAQQLQSYINQELAAGAPIDAAFDVQVNITSEGRIEITSRGDVQIDATGGANGMGADALETHLGLIEDTHEAVDPYFDVQLGNDNVVRITIEPIDDETDLFDKLDHDGTGGDAGVPGLAVDTDLTAGGGNGFLIIRPGDDPSSPTFGGDLRITGGPFETAGSVGIVEALFGSSTPISQVGYSSPNYSGPATPFRTQNLGASATLNTQIISSTNLTSYAQNLVKAQTDEGVRVNSQRTDENAFKNLLGERLTNETSVNIEEELANLISVQTAFAASARVIAAIEEQFDEFLRSI